MKCMQGTGEIQAVTSIRSADDFLKIGFNYMIPIYQK
jgi:hypothetical protein